MSDDLRSPLWNVVTWLVLVFLALPVLVNFPISLTDNAYLSLPNEGLSLQHYYKLVQDHTWLQTAGRSVIVAASTAVLATIIGGLCAFASWQLSGWVAGAVRTLVLIPLVVPSIVSALGFRRLVVDLGLFDTYPGIILVYVIISVPYVFICVSTSLALFDIKLLHASRSLGANQFQSIRMILVPSIFPGLLAGAVLAFVNAWDELVILLFITGRSVILLPRKMMQGIQEDIDPSLAAAASVLVIMTTIGVLISLRYQKR
jgi:putative spermidine/putrescine transport system permease protein